MMEHIEVEYVEKDEATGEPYDACVFTKTTGIENQWDAVAWTDNPNVRNITWHTIGMDADRDFGFTNDPIADSESNPISNGVAVSLNRLGVIAPPAGLVVENAGAISTVQMDILEKKLTHFTFEGKPWGVNQNNKNVQQDMHAIMWIKQRCGKLKVTNQKLDVPCKLSEWSDWNQCGPISTGGKTCGKGTQDRTRTIIQQGTFGKQCTASLEENQACAQVHCPVNCELADWSVWGKCSEKCGGGESTRTRKINQKDAYGGTPCEATEETENCNFWVECDPADCKWSDWSAYSDCSEECNGGTHHRSRNIIQESKEGGEQCNQDDSAQIDTCNTQACHAIDCTWSGWGAWGECSATCNGGVRSKSRQVQTEAQYGGKKCDAASDQAEECSVQPCSDDWTAQSGADIAPDGVTFSNKDKGDAAVTSQRGVESISFRNGAVSGSGFIGLADDPSPQFVHNGAGKAWLGAVSVPYVAPQSAGTSVKDDDIITIGLQEGHAKLFVNRKFVEDLGKVSDVLLAKVILNAHSSVRVDGIVISRPSSASVLLREAAVVPEQTNVPSWTLSAAMAAASVSMMVAIAFRRSRPVVDGVQRPLLQQ